MGLLQELNSERGQHLRPMHSHVRGSWTIILVVPVYGPSIMELYWAETGQSSSSLVVLFWIFEVCTGHLNLLRVTTTIILIKFAFLTRKVWIVGGVIHPFYIGNPCSTEPTFDVKLLQTVLIRILFLQHHETILRTIQCSKDILKFHKFDDS